MKRNTLIIAEAGVNHNGSLSVAKELIFEASKAGADFVKFQTFNSKLNISVNAKQADYQIQNTGIRETQLEMVSRLELPKESHIELIEYAKKCNIGIFSTGFDLPSIDFLNDLGFELFKIPSGEINNLLLLEKVGSLNKKLLMSTGMSNLADIERAIDILEENGTDRKNIVILHCTTEYPAPFDEINLQAMNTLRLCFGTEVGYSDHTNGIEVAIAAVALGASVIEKHFTLDKNMDGPDHKASTEPNEFALMVKSIRNIEIALGTKLKIISPSEKKNLEIARKSLVASSKINKGDKFTSSNISIKRPGTGISPMSYYKVLGKIANENFEIDDLIKL